MLNSKQIIEILAPWNFWQHAVMTGIDREVYVAALYQQKDLKEVSVVLGVRRSGKSTVLLQTIKKLIECGVPARHTLYVNFEEPAFAPYLTLEFLLQLYQSYQEQLKPTGTVYIVLDEIHLVPGWERFVRGLYDKSSAVKIYLTGSAAHLLSKEYGVALTGRTYTTIVWPLSFNEFLSFKQLASAPSQAHLLQEYLEYGGFPQIVLTKRPEDKRHLLKEQYSALLEKDVVTRYAVRAIRELKECMLYIVSQSGLPLSGYAVAAQLGITQPTVNKFLEYAREVWLIRTVEHFSYSLARRFKHPKKVYVIDPGLYQAISLSWSENKGRLFETVVAIGLLRHNEEIFYWQAKQEVDFVVRRGRKIVRLINVCLELTVGNREREVAGLRAAMQEFKLTTAEIITVGQEEVITVPEGMIAVRNFFSVGEVVGWGNNGGELFVSYNKIFILLFLSWRQT